MSYSLLSLATTQHNHGSLHEVISSKCPVLRTTPLLHFLVRNSAGLLLLVLVVAFRLVRRWLI